MQNNFDTYLKNTLKLAAENNILLAVSGGADSVAMLDLFAKAGFKCGIAHCNFRLRGKESDKDEELVAKLAKKYNFPFYKIAFDTKKHASDKGISIEMAARELRYVWFEKIRLENNYDFVATAHHRSDLIETFFMNLVRGTGIRGLSGIKPISGKLVRPLLFTDREQILNYIDKNILEYREDASNKDVKIKRNKFRHDIIPQLAEINPAYKKNIIETIERLNITNEILKEKVTGLEKKITTKNQDYVQINIHKLKEQTHARFFLFEILAPFGFNKSQTKDIFNALDGISGKSFYSTNYKLIKERGHLLILPNEQTKQISFKLQASQIKLNLQKHGLFELKEFEKTADFKIPHQLDTAALDKDKLQFPLEIRNWRAGDYFYPIGMNKRKKLSDFFIDNKFSNIEKKEALLLVSANKIVWIIGHRIDNRFKITGQTKNIWQITKTTV